MGEVTNCKYRGRNGPGDKCLALNDVQDYNEGWWWWWWAAEDHRHDNKGKSRALPLGRVRSRELEFVRGLLGLVIARALQRPRTCRGGRWRW